MHSEEAALLYGKKNRFRGVLIGVMLGDAFGLAVERRGEAVFRDNKILGQYSDDTQMTLALAECLADNGVEMTQEQLAQSFAEHYDIRRGYGGFCGPILEDIRDGTPWHLAVAKHKPKGGSWGNGCAMRIAPLALVGKEAMSTEAMCAVTGHTHEDALFWAEAQWAQIRCLAVGSRGRRNPAQLRSWVGKFIMKGPRYRWIANNLDMPPEAAAKALGNGYSAAEAVPCAIWAFWSAFEKGPVAVLHQAARIGGDVDTITSMAGALAGGYFGYRRWPKELVDQLENGERGKDFALGLADDLAELAWDLSASDGQ